jgi:hypothetical protein
MACGSIANSSDSTLSIYLGGPKFFGTFVCTEPEFTQDRSGATFHHCTFQVGDEMLQKCNAPQRMFDVIHSTTTQSTTTQPTQVECVLKQDGNTKLPVYQCDVHTPDEKALTNYITYGLENPKVPDKVKC